MLVILLIVLLIGLGLLFTGIKEERNENEVIEECFVTEEVQLEEAPKVEKPRRRKSAFIEWDDEPDTHRNKKYHTHLYNKINVTLNTNDDSDNHQTLPTNGLFKVNDNSEGIEFLCSYMRQGKIEEVIMIMYELSHQGDTGEIYQYLDEKFNLSQLLFDYRY